MTPKSYAIWWNEGSGPRQVGKLELAPLHALFSGNGSTTLVVPLDDIKTVAYGRGQMSIDRRTGTPLRIGNLDGPGALLELAHSLSA